MKRILPLLCALLLLIGGSGCGQMLDRSYTYIEEHYEQPIETGDSSSLVVKNYIGLKNAVLYLLEQGEEYGVIRAYDYSGDVSADLTEVCLSVKQSTPLGAYAVDYTSHEKINIVAYTELHIYITYRRTQEQIRNIIDSNLDELPDRIGLLMLDCGEYAAYSLSYFTNDVPYVMSIIDGFYAEQYYPVSPRFEVTLYPESGVARIIEVTVEYDGGRAVFLARSDQLEGLRAELLAGLPTQGSTMEKYIYLAEAVRSRAEYDYDTQDKLNTDGFVGGYEAGAYGALVGGLAVSRGYAEAFSQLCGEAGLSCMIVSGVRDDEPWYWNLVELEDGWYHVDTAGDDISGESARVFRSDDEQAQFCQWTRSQYPESGEALPLEPTQ